METFAIPKFEGQGALLRPLGEDGKVANESAAYHEYEVLAGHSTDGELAMALVGVTAATRHILSRTYDRVTPDAGYHSFEIRNGELFGQVGAIEHAMGSWPPSGIDS
jgi:hypothetical protein